MGLRDAPISEAKCEILVIGSEAAGARAAIEGGIFPCTKTGG